MSRQDTSLDHVPSSGTFGGERSAASISKSFVRRLTTPPPPEQRDALSDALSDGSGSPLSISMNVIESESSEKSGDTPVDIVYHPYSDVRPVSIDRPSSDLRSSPVHDTSIDHNELVSPSMSQQYEHVTYHDVDSEQKNEFEKLLKKETSWRRTFVHKGLMVNILFLIVMVVSIILGEVFFPLEGVRGEGIAIVNDSSCANQTAGCVTLRIVRAVGVFGFIGGITNWIAVEILFRSIPCLIGTGVIAKGYKEIRQSICSLVVNTLFDPVGLRQYFSTKKKSLRQILHLETHFGSLLDSDAANQIIETKIDLALKRPEGFVLTMMGVDHNELKLVLRRHIRSFINDISPTIQDKMVAPGLRDGVGIQNEVEKILEERVVELSAMKVNQLVSVMIRKHLSWLIVWGNVFGALVGLLAEVTTVTVAKYAT